MEDQKEQICNFFQEIFNSEREEDNPIFITKWVVVVEGQSLEGNRTIAMKKSNTPPWDALGLMEWTIDWFKDKHGPRD